MGARKWCVLYTKDQDSGLVTYSGSNFVWDLYLPIKANKASVSVHVADVNNAGSLDAKCSLGLDANAMHEFASGSNLQKGSVHTFHVDIPGDSDFSNVYLSCSSPSQDALYVQKIVVHGDNGDYEGDVNAVYDDANSCNTKKIPNLPHCGANGADKCCNDQVGLALTKK